MWTEQFNSMLMLMVIAALLRTSYEVSCPKAKPSEGLTTMAKTFPVEGVLSPTAITPQQREWAEKAVRNYAQAQEKKWQRWNGAMFEAVKEPPPLFTGSTDV